jgi:hypothetical protein
MSIDMYERCLEFLERSHIDQARLLGGEPTLHPAFPAFVDRALRRGLRVVVFSNGFMPETAVAALEHADAERVSVLVNASAGSGRAPAEQADRKDVLRRLGPRAALGVNVHRPSFDSDGPMVLIDRYGLSRTLRIGLAHPRVNGRNEFLRARHYDEVGRRLGIAAQKASEAGIRLEFDCGFVPCMFPPGVLEAFGDAAREVGRRCNPILDVLPGGNVISCYPLADLGSEPLPPERDADWLRERFQERAGAYRVLGVFRRCRTCRMRDEGRCIGGCLAAALTRLQEGPFAICMPAEEPPRAFARRRRVSGHPEPHPRVLRKAPARGPLWVIPYIDQPLDFWTKIHEAFDGHIRNVYFPLPSGVIGSGRPIQPKKHLHELLRRSPFALSVLANPVTLPEPLEIVAPRVIEELRLLAGEFGVAEVTVTDIRLAERIRCELPRLALVASSLMGIERPDQLLALSGVCDGLVPSTRILRDLPALERLRRAFPGRLRLIVNEGCLPSCPFRVQHFYEMTMPLQHPKSLCDDFLRRTPWLRLTGSWVLPQHLRFFEGLYDELKLSGRVTLRDERDYLRVLSAYVHRLSLTPDLIGGGPASVLEPIEVTESFYAETLRCGRHCQDCRVCRSYYDQALERLGSPRGSSADAER